MAGALTISTLNNDTGVLATQNGMTGICKAWVNFAGSTGTIASSFNVSSITKSATGNYTLNYTTNLPNTNYAVIGTVARSDGSVATLQINAGLYSTSQSAVLVYGIAGSTQAAYDSTITNVAVFSS